MWLFEQKHPHYGDKDSVGIMRDIRLVTGALSSSEELRSTTEARCIAIIEDPNTYNASFRNSFFQAKDSIVWSHVWNTSDLKNHDASNLEYHRLLSLHEIVLSNPTATLEAIEQEIQKALDAHGTSASEISSILTKVKDTEEDNFSQFIEQGERQLWHTGVIFYLEWCIEKWKCIEKVMEYTIWRMKGLYETRHKSMQYWDFHNVLRLTETKSKLRDNSESNLWNSKAFVISGWAGNTLASLWVIQAHLESWWSIKALSWTSMGGMISVLVWSIGNNLEGLKALINDIVNGFEIDSINYGLPKWDLYKPWNARRAKSYVERLLSKYGISGNLNSVISKFLWS